MASRDVDGGLNYYSRFAHSLPTDVNYFPIGVWLESVLSQSDINLDKAIDINLYVGVTRNNNLSLLGPNGMHAFLQTEWLDARRRCSVRRRRSSAGTSAGVRRGGSLF